MFLRFCSASWRLITGQPREDSRSLFSSYDRDIETLLWGAGCAKNTDLGEPTRLPKPRLERERHREMSLRSWT
jgi:hypothetical protein